jgi:hypothetical protein
VINPPLHNIKTAEKRNREQRTENREQRTENREAPRCEYDIWGTRGKKQTEISWLLKGGD